MYTFTNVWPKHDIVFVFLLMSSQETKNTWARDDPAILVLIGACLCGMFHIFDLGVY